MNMLIIAIFCVLVAASVAAGEPARLTVSSGAFAHGQPIPSQYTCDGQDISPPLKWEGAPAAAKTFALICDDPDAPAGTWVHWVIYNLPGGTTSLSGNTPKTATLTNGAGQGLNSFRHIGYGGPCPPGAQTHRYFFKVYALDGSLSFEGRPTQKELLAAMKGHILAEGQLMGTYQRK